MAPPLWREAEREAAYRVYLTDAAMLISGNTARIGGGQVLRGRWAEAVFPPRAEASGGGSVVESVLAALEEKAGVRIVDGRL